MSQQESDRNTVLGVMMDRAGTSQRPQPELLRAIAQLSAADRSTHKVLSQLSPKDTLRQRLDHQRIIEEKRRAMYEGEQPWINNRGSLENMEAELRSHIGPTHVDLWFQRDLIPFSNQLPMNFTYRDLHSYLIAEDNLNARGTPFVHILPRFHIAMVYFPYDHSPAARKAVLAALWNSTLLVQEGRAGVLHTARLPNQGTSHLFLFRNLPWEQD